MSSDQKVLAYFKRFEKNFPNIVDLFKSRNVKQVISNLIDRELLPLSSDYDPRTINPFDELLADALEDSSGLYYQYLKNLETSLHRLIPETENRFMFRRTYRKMWGIKNKKEENFWEAYNEIDVLHWVVRIGRLEDIEAKSNKEESTKGIDFKAVIGGATVYGEILSQSELGFRGSHRKLKAELDKVIKEELGTKYFTSISSKALKVINLEEYVTTFKKFLYEINSFNYGQEVCETNKEYITRQLEEKGRFRFFYPTAKTKYDFEITISAIKKDIEIIPIANDEMLLDKICGNVYKKLNDEKDGKLKAFPEGEINLLIIFIARYHDIMMWKFHKFDNLDEHFFQRLRIKIEKVLDKKISGHIIRTFYYESKDETLKHFNKVYLNPNACRPIPKLVFDALSK